MKRLTATSSALALASMIHAGAAAQETSAEANAAQPSVELSPVRVEGTGDAPVSHRFGEPVDSGTSRFDQASIEARAPGSGDVNEVLRALPTVQFSSQNGRATRAELQDLRPANISISGGSFTENLFVVDGIGVNSRLDVSSSNPNHYIEGNAAASAQSLWIDSSLVGSITVRDSNISAEYGQFTGGVVQIDTRAPARTLGISAHYGETGPDFAQFRMSKRNRDLLGDNVIGEPDYLKRRYGANLDLPVADSLRFLFGYSFSESRVTYERGTNYARYGNYRQQSVSENFLAKAELDLSDDLLLTGQLTYSPYESEFSHPNGIDNWVYLDGGGLTGSLKLEGSGAGEARWKVEVSHARSDNDRRVDRPGTINIQSTAPGVDWCSGTSCSLGAPNPINQRQWDTTIKAQWEQPALGGDIRFGLEYARVKAVKEREETSAAYRHISSSGSGSTLGIEISPNTVCVPPVTVEGICVDGAYALAQMLPEMAFVSRVKLDSYTLWGEWQGDIAGFEVRTGLRYDHESFLGNHNVAPRLSVSRDLPLGINLTLGANRYYGRSFLGYALRENYPDSYIYRRAPQVVDGKNLWSENWTLYSHSILPRYSNAGLKTPYVDELTFALRGPAPLIGGEYRIRGILRDARNRFARSEEIQTREPTETGGIVTVRSYEITNDAKSSYRGLSLEYVREFGNHSVSISTNLSKTKSTAVDYFAMADETEFDGDQVYYQGEIVSLLQVIANNQRDDYAAPFIVNFDWSAHWFGKRLRTNVNARYRSGFERVDDTGVNIRIDGINYDVYDIVKFDDAVSFDLSAALDVLKTPAGVLTLDLRVNNLFNTVLESQYSSSSQPWQLGRNAWISAKFTF